MSPRHQFITRIAVCAASLTMALSADSVEALPCWRPPVAGVVVDPFRAPSCRYCAGNRGLEYRVAGGSVVRAVDAGTVSYSGAIAGVRYVVVEHGNGWKTTYGRLVSTTLGRGDVVSRGAVVGRVEASLYFGLRIHGAYRDPAPHLGRLVGRPRLVPVDGTPRRPPPPGVWRCGR